MAARGEEEHGFDRRLSDVNVAALATRLTAIEGRVEVLEQVQRTQHLELKANTALTRQLHEAAFGREPINADDHPDPGLKQKVDRMYDIFAGAEKGFKFLNTSADVATKIARPTAYLLAIGAAVSAWWHTGNWKWP